MSTKNNIKHIKVHKRKTQVKLPYTIFLKLDSPQQQQQKLILHWDVRSLRGKTLDKIKMQIINTHIH